MGPWRELVLRGTRLPGRARSAWILPLFHLLMPERYWEATEAVPPLSIAAMATGAYAVTAVGLERDEADAPDHPYRSPAIVAVGLYFLLIPPYGFVGAAWATAGGLWVAVHLRGYRLAPDLSGAVGMAARRPGRRRHARPGPRLARRGRPGALRRLAPVRVATTLAYPAALLLEGFPAAERRRLTGACDAAEAAIPADARADRPRRRRRRAWNGRALRAAGQRRARGAARRLRHERGGRGAVSLRRLRAGPGRADPGFGAAIVGLCDREGSMPFSRSRRTTSPAWRRSGLRSARAGRPPSSAPETVRRANDKAECYALLAEAGVPVPAFVRASGAQRLRRRRQGPRLPGARRLLAGDELGLAWFPRCRPRSRSHPPASARAPRQPRHAAGGRRRALAGGWWRRASWSSRADRAHRRRDRARGPRRLRPSEDARGDARRARDVLPDAGRPRAAGRGRAGGRSARDRPLLQRPARGRPRHRGQPAHLHGRLPGRPNLPYLGLKHALGELSDDELSAYRSRVRASRALRWFDQVEWDD